MNAAEGVVKLWLNAKGFFVMSNLKFGRAEADILAVRIDPMSGEILDRVHCEVSVSSTPWGSRKSEQEGRDEAKDYYQKKFWEGRFG